MNTKELNNELLLKAQQATSIKGLPVGRVRSDRTIGTIILPPDKRRRVVLDTLGERRVVGIGKLDLIAPGKVIQILGERVIIKEVIQGEDGKFLLHGISNGELAQYFADDIDGVER